MTGPEAEDLSNYKSSQKKDADLDNSFLLLSPP
jgi:hypothetical protein